MNIIFTEQELTLFKSNYFSNFSYRNGIVEIQSKNTGHWWQFKKVEMPICNKILLYHKYTEKDKYHKQCHVQKIWKVFRMIQEHDEYILNKVLLSD